MTKKQYYHWTEEEINILMNIWDKKVDWKTGMSELHRALPKFTRTEFRNKVYQLYGRKEYTTKPAKLAVEPIDWGKELNKSYVARAAQYGAQVINGVLMKDGKRTTWMQLAG